MVHGGHRKQRWGTCCSDHDSSVEVGQDFHARCSCWRWVPRCLTSSRYGPWSLKAIPRGTSQKKGTSGMMALSPSTRPATARVIPPPWLVPVTIIRLGPRPQADGRRRWLGPHRYKAGGNSRFRGRGSHGQQAGPDGPKLPESGVSPAQPQPLPWPRASMVSDA